MILHPCQKMRYLKNLAHKNKKKMIQYLKLILDMDNFRLMKIKFKLKVSSL